MAGRFTVESIFKGIDKISGPTKKMSRRVSKFTRKMGNSFRKLNAKIGGLTATAKKAGLGIAAGLAIGTAALAGVVNTGADFEQSLLNASAKLGRGLQKDSAEFTSLFDSLEKTASSIGKKTEFTAEQAARGLNTLAQAGFSAEQAISSMPGLVDLATASEVDLGDAALIASDTLNAFGLSSKDAATQAENLRRASDVLATVASTSSTNMQLLFESITKGAPQFRAAGADIETFATLTGVLANSSLKASESGTGLRNFFLRLAGPTKEAADALDDLKVKTGDGHGNFRDAIDILEDLDKALEGKGTKERSAILKEIFGVKTINTVNVLLAKGGEGLRAYRKQVTQSKGAVHDMAEIMRSGVGGAIKKMSSSLEGLRLTFFKINKSGFLAIIENVTKWIRKADDFLEKNDQLVEGLSGDLFKSVVAVVEIFGGFVAIVVGLNAWLLLVNASVFAFDLALGALNIVIGAASFVFSALTGVVALLNAAFMANPVVFTIAAIVALIAIGYLLIKNWDQIKAFFISTWESIVETVRLSINTIKNLIEKVSQPFKDLFSGVSGIKAKVSNFFGFSGGESGKTVSQQDRISRSISESRETSQTEVTIKAEKGTSAEITNRRGKGRGLTLQQSGAF